MKHFKVKYLTQTQTGKTKEVEKTFVAPDMAKAMKVAMAHANTIHAAKILKLEEIEHFVWGFDLTSIDATKWEQILTLFQVPLNPRLDDDSCAWVWENSNKSLRIHTGNNPITGEYSRPKQRTSEKHYASAIGIYGTDKDLVEMYAKLISKFATYIKEETPHESRFI